SIPSSVTEIGECAFLYQYNLERVIFKDPAKTTLSHIGRKAFSNTNLSGIDLPKFGGTWKDNGGNTNRPAIGSLAFAGIRNTAFETFVVPEGVVSIYEIWQNDQYPGNHWKYVYLPSTLKRYDNARDMGLLQAFFYNEPTELVHVYYNGSRSQFFTKTLGKNTKKLQDAWINTLGDKLTFSKVIFNAPAPKPVSKLTPQLDKASILKYYDEISEPNQATIDLAIAPADHAETEYRVVSSDESVVRVCSPAPTESDGKISIIVEYKKKIGEATLTVTGGFAKTEIPVVIKEKDKIDPPSVKVVGGKKVDGVLDTYTVKYGDWIVAESDTRDCSFYYQIGTSGSWTFYPNGLRVGREIFSGDKSDIIVKAKARSAKEDLLDSEESTGITLKYALDMGDVTEYDLTGHEYIPAGMWIPETSYNEEHFYTGSAVTCKNLRVFYYNKLLRKGKDYTVKYFSNVNTPAVSGKTPSFTVTGKGNYKGFTASGEFTIKQVDLNAINEADVNYVPVTLTYKAGKAQKADIGLKVNGRKLVLERDYELIYPGDSTSVKDPGTYRLHVLGLGNYKGEINSGSAAVFVVNPAAAVKMSDVTISKIRDQQLVKAGMEVEPAAPTVKYKGKTLPAGGGGAYTIEYRQNTAAGTAKAIIKGTGNPVNVGGKTVSFMGAKTVTFKIKPISVSNATVSDVEDFPYSGSAWTQAATVELGGEDLTEGRDYRISYKNNVKPGTATMTVTGKGNYGGTKKVTFKITKAALTEENVYELSYDEKENKAFYYTKGWVKPKVKVLLPGAEKLLTTKDYSVTYKNISAPGEENAASVTITGKRYVTGSVTINFTIKEGHLDRCKTTFTDKVYANKGGIYKQKLTIKDVNGKKLRAGADYDSKIRYYYKEDTYVRQKSGRSYVVMARPSGSAVNDKDIIPAGTTIRVEIIPKGNYDYAMTGYFRIGKKNISSSRPTIKDQKYTGHRILPSAGEIKGLDYADYEIISYGTNIKHGTGTVTVRGLGNYIGTKTIKFKIK
ncbi:MAG: leucine-rich repeat domain-containing protein, partial [Lachnospiraceae bacterium]|nr:leucine-rich repeat domain-containing protein [Lachnospiraceae bacterium]